ncbi:MAG: hypothetical protein WCI73_07720 [Phycisphaerae bacterium]
MADTSSHSPYDDTDDDVPENYSFHADAAPDDADLKVPPDDLGADDLVKCPRCHKYCLNVYDLCPRCKAALTVVSRHQPRWYLLTVALVLGLIIIVWILQNYSPLPAH